MTKNLVIDDGGALHRLLDCCGGWQQSEPFLNAVRKCLSEIKREPIKQTATSDTVLPFFQCQFINIRPKQGTLDAVRLLRDPIRAFLYRKVKP